MIMILPKPREATSVAIRIGALPVLNSKRRKMYFKYEALLGKTTFVAHNNLKNTWLAIRPFYTGGKLTLVSKRNIN